jgi:acyl-CoA synthetase (AMP-forming)/AMP-acid ligase II
VADRRQTADSASEPVPALLLRRARDHGERPAVIDDRGRVLRIAEWAAAAESAARGLIRRGIAPGDRVGLLFANANAIDLAIAYGAIALSGAVAVPISPSAPDREVLLLRGRAEATLLLTDRQRLGVSLRDVTAASTSPLPHIGLDSLAELIFTSGTTGEPKGVEVSHRNLIEGYALDRPPGPATGVHVHAVALGANFGQMALRLPLVTGMATRVLSSFEPGRFRRAVRDLDATHATLAPAMVVWLLAAAGDPLPTLRQVTVASAPMPSSAMEQLQTLVPNATIRNAYGSTESWPAVTLMEYGRDPLGSVGRPPRGGEVRVLRADGSAAGIDEPGEVLLRAPGVAVRQYWRDPQTTKAVFTSLGVRMGDVGRIDASGSLVLLGRTDDVIGVGGLKVSPTEVESVLLEHPLVVDAGVVGVFDAFLGQRVAAGVVLRDDLPWRELRRHAACSLNPLKIPLRFLRVDALPRTPAGKIRVRELRRMLEAGQRGLEDPRP